MLKFRYRLIKLSQAFTSQRLISLYSTMQPDNIGKRCSQTMQWQNEIFPSFACDLQIHFSNYNTEPNHRITGSLND